MNIIQILQNVPTEVWPSLAAIIGVSAFQQKLKSWLELESPRVLVLMTGVLSLAGAIVPAILGWMSANPGQVASHAALWFTGLNFAYRYVIQPGGSLINQVQTEKQRQAASKAASAASSLPSPSTAQLEALASEPTPTEAAAAALPAGVPAEFNG